MTQQNLTETNNIDPAGVGQLDTGTVRSEQNHVASAPPSKYLMSLTGFDEIAVAAHFGMKVTTLRQEDAITLGRALAFVHYRRNEGMADAPAYQTAMDLTMQQVVDFFPPEPKPTNADGTDAEPDGLDAQYAEMAVAIVRIGIAPSEWKALTHAERAAITTEHNTCAMEARARRN